jgi:DNA polymerase III sliding clamp (beta) subunit (PCNA family)
MSTLTVECADLVTALKAVRHAAANDEARPVLASVLLEGDREGFRAVAADNYRIAIQPIPAVGRTATWKRAIVYRDDVDLILRMLKRAVGVIVLGHTDGALTLRHPSFEFSTRLMDGKYPPYDEVVAKVTWPVVGAFNPRFLADIAKGTSDFQVKLRMRRPTDPIAIEGSSGFVEIIMPIRLPDGEAMPIAEAKRKRAAAPDSVAS